MATIPQDKSLDNTLSLLKDGYDFLLNKRKENGTDVLAIRFMGMNVICLGGEEGAKLFYDPDKFQRSGAVPKRIQKTLVGEDAIHTLDGEKHRRRKQVFLTLASDESIQNLTDCLLREWEAILPVWEQKGEVTLFPEMQQLITRAACTWAGVPLPEEEVEQRAQDFTAMVDAFGAVGPRHWRGKRARSRTEEWIIGVIEQIRDKRLYVAEGSPASVIAAHTEDGQLLEPRLAAVELINMIRPTVAVSYFITFAAVALHEYPECRQRLREGDPQYLEWFAQEVRRFYPIAPFMGALVREDFEWKGYQFEKGTMVMLDIFGTIHDEKIWAHPEQFRPERFSSWDGSPFNFIPHGGGYPDKGHRCPGERITLETLKIAVDHLVNRLRYDVPQQDLSYSLRRMPTYPESGFVMNNVKVI
ncbi:cytochrome P450 [Telluribacter sp. SYSU D00476]|uniref:cytochrome P450 n=1 Tax=Telluribacter sp. SYSU D00476 TaxID=2811430 RepID=UPI001FF1D264|nr:cytochrome P450 [Telluribacter sp. SYSU D00476]